MSGPSHPDSSVATEPPRFCRHCGYNLRGLIEPRCPECGRGFDPNDPRTYRKRPARRWLRRVMWAGGVVGALVLILAGTWGWFYWGWHDERQALLALKVDPDDPDHVVYTPLVSPGQRTRLGPAGFVFDRTSFLWIPFRSEPVDLAPVAHLPQLQRLRISWASVSDLGPLAGLTNLRELYVFSAETLDLAPLRALRRLERLQLYGPGIQDLGALASLGQLQVLEVQNTSVTDLRPLAGLTNLRTLLLRLPSVTDIAPLLCLATLQDLDLEGTRLTDPSPLAKLKGLRRLVLPGTVTVDQVNALRREMPADCDIQP